MHCMKTSQNTITNTIKAVPCFWIVTPFAKQWMENVFIKLKGEKSSCLGSQINEGVDTSKEVAHTLDNSEKKESEVCNLEPQNKAQNTPAHDTKYLRAHLQWKHLNQVPKVHKI